MIDDIVERHLDEARKHKAKRTKEGDLIYRGFTIFDNRSGRRGDLYSWQGRMTRKGQDALTAHGSTKKSMYDMIDKLLDGEK